jgi:glucan biosynthesis protein C
MLFIDNIRWTVILLVLSMHATDTYSPFGNWYYTDRSQTTLTTALIFGGFGLLRHNGLASAATRTYAQ